MRAPVKAIEPSSSGVVKVTRGERDSASSRLTICCPAGCAGVGAPGTPVGVVPGAVVGAPGAPGAVWLACCCGGVVGLAGNRVCQPMMMTTESTMATMKFF
jgi:hypothetical protein